jgi:hypothetical protein
MQSHHRAIGKTVAVVIIIAAIFVAAVPIVLLASNPRIGSGPVSAPLTTNTGSSTSCDQPAYLIRLASQVEQTQTFAQHSHGLSYVVAYGNNQSATTGTAGGKPFYSPPQTNLALYSYGAPTAYAAYSTPVCPSDVGTKGVVGALWIYVPIKSDNSYDLANMSVFFTPGVFANSTEATQTTGNATSTNTISTICTVAVEGAGTYLHVVSDSTQRPLPGIPVHVLPTANSCFGASRPGPATYTTNATGWVSIGGMQANYYFDVSLADAGSIYNFSLPQGPLDSTNATLSLPSGNLSVSLCYTMASTNPCKPYAESATTITQQCSKPSDGFLVIASDRGYNDSVDHGAPQNHWPVINVQVGQTVNIVVCNVDNQAHGFQIARYLNSTTITVVAGQSQTFSFVANQAGTFQIYNGIFDTTGLYEQSGELIVVG